MQLEELARRQTEKLRNDAQDNRKRFPQAAYFKDAIERVFGKCKLIRATNAAGESIGPVDAEPWIACQDFGAYGDAGVSVSRNSTVRRTK